MITIFRIPGKRSVISINLGLSLWDNRSLGPTKMQENYNSKREDLEEEDQGEDERKREKPKRLKRKYKSFNSVQKVLNEDLVN